MTIQSQALASALVERNRGERLAYERRAAELRERLALLAPSLGATRVWIIGSLTTRFWGAASDVDVVVEGLASELRDHVWAKLEVALAHKVDLLRIEELEPTFALRVRREGVVLV